MRLDYNERLNQAIAEHVMGGETGNYSIRIEDAWRVVERIRDTGTEVNIMDDRLPVGGERVRVLLVEFTSPETAYSSAYHHNVATAICQAALKLYGVDVQP